MGAGLPKQYLPLNGRTVLEHSLWRLAACPGIAGIAVALAAQDAHWPQLALPPDVAVHTTTGGAQRCHSVLNGLHALAGLAQDEEWVLVHDAARPCVRVADIRNLMTYLADHPVGGLLGVPVNDTVKRADSAATIIETVDRHGLWRALTPQMFRYAALRCALQDSIKAGVTVTDEASAMEWAGHAPRLVEGQGDNIKITRPEDLPLAAYFLQQQQSE
ncbi:MAG: 2-C-methyl-D-erythritol 4-phosphate cytidylyltransferase [Gammaproteobacteria bacterium RBG_16_57_12]|nr:MAG: 2-C-methyl-D-erythritol 4-phosphate cytidylyltransferase [Gammaproteobacteria bacterium RBG_16_57_12]